MRTTTVDCVRNPARARIFMCGKRAVKTNRLGQSKHLKTKRISLNAKAATALLRGPLSRLPRNVLALISSALAHAPLINRAAPVLSRLVAANRRCLAGDASRLLWLKVAVVLAFCVGLLMSPHLWVGPRSFPPAPVASSLTQIEGLAAYALFAALLLLAAAILVAPKPRWLIAAFLAVIGVFCLLDQTRWQPWVYLYSFLLATLAVFSWEPGDFGGQQSTLDVARLIVACTYIFSGLQKVNLNFIDNDFPWIVSPITNLLPSTAGLFHLVGMTAPVVQIAFGVGLLTNRLRRASLLAAIAMHVFILAMFGPAGLDWNNIIWPWTAAMAVFDVLLFAGQADYSAAAILSTRGRPYHAFVLLAFAGLPILSFFNLWDSYLSAALYSGNLTEAQIYVTDAGRASLPAWLGERFVRTSDDTNVLNLQRWSIEDLNVTPYPEARVYKAIARRVCGRLRDPTQLVLIVREQRLLFSPPETGYRCWQL
jgi:hypothetical protein